MNPIDELKRHRPNVDPLTDNMRRQLRGELFDAGTGPMQEHKSHNLSPVDIGARRRPGRRTPARAVASVAAVAALVLAVGAALAAESSSDDVVANGPLESSSPTSPVDGDNGGPWTPPTVAPSPPDLPLVGHYAWRQLLPFYYSPSDNQRMYALYMAHIAECMEEGGLSFTPLEISGLDLLAVVSPLDRDAAKALGYHEPSDGVPASPTRSPAEYEYEAACANTASRETFGATEEFSMTVDAAVPRFDAAVNGWFDTEQGKAKLAEWSACMAEAGYDYSAPNEPKTIFQEKPTLSERELATRLADLDCDIEVGLTEARSAYEESAARRWIANNEALVADLVEQKADYDETLDRLEAEVESEG